ncbi:LytR/AlgR family response regulator transcription factor [Spirosoma endbachense]|uniref:HTH LytTR-type domain-containing protein n=1 Tax=Spirosoma endbachense TaxID=2666025 RepID=A0A6P1VWG0_9BACT|nr:hypothetical protein GJR95_19045 [Spirosoma endbachense]
MSKSAHPKNETIKIPGIQKPIPVCLITHCKGYGNYTRIYCQGAKSPIVSSQTLKLFEDRLPSFLRANKSTLINYRHIVGVDRLDGRSMELMLANDAPIPVARRRLQRIRDKLALLKVPS